MKEKQNFSRIKDIMQKGTQFSASNDFTERILANYKIREIDARPILPVWIWLIIVLLFIVLMFFGGTLSSNTISLTSNIFSETIPTIFKELAESLTGLRLILLPAIVMLFFLIGMHHFLLLSKYKLFRLKD